MRLGHKISLLGRLFMKENARIMGERCGTALSGFRH
jgi:hypothetical protein